ncbi:hypothetical protein TYRP_014797 [Tyrophagus putrescentiae]|nr:hypothetical protein TYRP_014797 [Tyrophagus putrescentiae]
MFYFDYLIIFTRGFQSYRQVFDLIVINRQDFYQLNPQIRENWKNLLVFFWYSKGFDSRRVQLRCQTLPHWGPIEHSIRVKAVVQSTYYDLAIAFTVVCLAAFSPPIFAYTSSLAPAWGRQSPLRRMIIFTDISLALYCLGRITITSQVLSFALNLLITVQSAQQRTYNCQLAKMIALMKRRAASGQEKSALADSPAETTAAKSNKPQSTQDRNGRGRLHPSLATHLLTAFLRAHLQLVKATLTFDKEVISQTLFFAFAALFPFNLYAVSMLSLTTMATSARLILFFSPIYGDDSNSPCAADWEQYKDEHCYRLFPGSLHSHSEAEQVCSSHNSSMVSIHYAEEQAFLSSLLFAKHKVVDNVWLGARYVGGGRFQWADHSSLKTGGGSGDYSNWMTGSPKNLTDYCLQMVADVSLLGKWADEPCTRKNLVVCQRTPTLSLKLLAETMIVLKHRLAAAEGELVQLKNDSSIAAIPVGFIYVQLPKHKGPEELWPRAVWKEVSAEFEGVFFRVVGGNASEFGKVQQENAPRLETVYVGDTNVMHSGQKVSQNHNLTIPVTGWSDPIITGGDYNGNYYFYMNFKHTDVAEVRPKNMAVRVFQRTA